MTRRLWWRPGVLAVLGAVVAAGCAADRTVDHPIVQPGKPGEPNRTLSVDEAEAALPVPAPSGADLDYVESMIAHHHQAVEMTALAPGRVRDEKLAGLADRISDVQRAEIDMMNGYLARHGLPEVDPENSLPGHHGDHRDMPGMATDEEMAALGRASGAEFDRLFLELMIRHHEGAIAMATRLHRSAGDAAVQQMADDVIAEQTDEIATMRAMSTS